MLKCEFEVVLLYVYRCSMMCIPRRSLARATFCLVCVCVWGVRVWSRLAVACFRCCGGRCSLGTLMEMEDGRSCVCPGEGDVVVGVELRKVGRICGLCCLCVFIEWGDLVLDCCGSCRANVVGGS